MQNISNHKNTQITAQNPVINDRRQYQAPSLDNSWDKLTLAQQFSVASLGQFGYSLSFIRNINQSTLAILHLANKTATISTDGIINITSGIELRH